MISEGVIDKEKFDSFYVPVYGPSSQELRDITEEDGSFSIREMRVHGSTTDLSGAPAPPSRFMKGMRAVFGPMIVQHFRDVMDEFVRAGVRHQSREGRLQDVNLQRPRLWPAISLTKARGSGA